MKIIVDADSCPVMDDIIAIAEKHNVMVWFVADYAHAIQSNSPLVERKLIDQSPDAVDIYIMNVIENGDVVVTNDIGLAGMVLGKAAHVISSTGRQYSRDTIESLLEHRHHARKLRRAGARLKQRQRSYADSDRSRFRLALDTLLHGLLSSPHNALPDA